MYNNKLPKIGDKLTWKEIQTITGLRFSYNKGYYHCGDQLVTIEQINETNQEPYFEVVEIEFKKQSRNPAHDMQTYRNKRHDNPFHTSNHDPDRKFNVEPSHFEELMIKAADICNQFGLDEEKKQEYLAKHFDTNSLRVKLNMKDAIPHKVKEEFISNFIDELLTDRGI